MPVNRPWELPTAITVFIIALLNYVAWYLRVDQAYVIYANVTLASPLLLGGTCIISPVVLSVIGWNIVRDLTRSGYARTGQLVSAILVFIAGIVMFLSVSAWLGNTYIHLASIRLDDNIYNLASHNTFDDLGYGYYQLFECDSLGVSCKKVFRTDWGFDTIDSMASMSLAEEEHTIEITITDGSRDEVFRYNP